MHLILDLHNKLRSQVHPPASNMEYMVSSEDTAPRFTRVLFKSRADNCGVIGYDELRSFWVSLLEMWGWEVVLHSKNTAKSLIKL